MKKSPFLFCILSLLAGVPAAFANHNEEGGHDHSPLEEEMEHIGDAWKLVRRAIRDPEQFSAAAEQVAIMLEHAKKSLDLEPSLLAQQEGDAAKKEFLEGYRKGMKQTITLLEELHAALEEGDAEAAQKTVGKINDARKEGHKAYKPEDED
ncbi:cytochrome b562 [Pelagicoccus sp. SDUM812002]|uniref:cytochrome b562 n=1 Tax=Pelagicoccus sp. SDUM812002 TaxID=3041266 RepID=UPI0028108ACA|nr:cytochrome b562 [Pelagicoccus sp. SDUM812002]MDQ8186826.1 cytochrome b562 [Pelagicoccus sp. SDUM812002]